MSDHWIERNGYPVAVGLTEWAMWMETADRHVADDHDVAGYRVSTVFLGLDHSFGDASGPILYETMVFGEGDHEQWCDRYATRDEAAAGHARVVAALRTGSPLDVTPTKEPTP